MDFRLHKTDLFRLFKLTPRLIESAEQTRAHEGDKCRECFLP